jgi:hypothetical protein
MSDPKNARERHIMLDIETLGTTPGSVIVSLAAVEFDLYSGNIGATFHQRVSIQSCLDLGMTVDAGSLTFWLRQPEEARKEVYEKPRAALPVVLKDFSAWLNGLDSNPDNLRIWGNSSDFDCAILASAYERVKLSLPWKFWATRCVRTIAALYPALKETMKFEGIRHHPLHDCLHQVKYLHAIMARIGSP